MREIAVCLDVGGTFTKGMAFNQINQPLLKEINYYDSKSKQSKEIILTNFTDIIVDLVQQVSDEQDEVSFIGLAFPGPFDYEKGISYIKGLEKFASLYDINVKQALHFSLKHYNRKMFANTELYFINDAVAFAFGEHDVSKVHTGVYLTLGTGLGSTILKNKKIIRGAGSIPGSGMIYQEQFKDSIMDDYLSERGLQRLAKGMFTSDISGRELSKLAETNNAKALVVFEQFGLVIGEALKPFIKTLKPQEVVFGGQISKSFPYFKPSMLPYFPEEVRVRVSNDTSMSILNGIFSSYQN